MPAKTRCKRLHDLTLLGAIKTEIVRGRNGCFYTVNRCIKCRLFTQRRWMRNKRGGIIEKFISDFNDGSYGLKYYGKPCRTCGGTLRRWKFNCCVHCRNQKSKARTIKRREQRIALANKQHTIPSDMHRGGKSELTHMAQMRQDGPP